MRKLRLTLPLTLLALALGLIACGGGESDEDRIVEVIETSATSTDPADCTELATQAFLEQTEFDSGEEAVKGCESSAKDTKDDPDSVEVANVEVDGASAVADVSLVGGNYDGQTLAVALVEEEGDWKMNEIVGFTKLDKEKLARSYEEAFEAEDAFDPQGASCFGEAIRELPQPEVEEVLFGGSQDPLLEIIEGCIQR